ncbi:nucleoside 2-deoxyribosyltransferase [Rhizobium beringeri]
MTKKVYLAGPEVFLPNAREMLDRKAALAREAGLIPLSPGDLEIPRTRTRSASGRRR